MALKTISSNGVTSSILEQPISDSFPAQPTNPSQVDRLFIHWLPKRLKERPNLVNTNKSIYQWNLLRNGKLVSIWTLDLKNGNGSVYWGPCKDGKPDSTITMDEQDASDMYGGTMDAAKAFMSGKIKLSGNVSAAHKFQQFWSEEMSSEANKKSATSFLKESDTQTTADTKKSTQASDEFLKSIPIDGLKSDIVFNIIRTRMSEEPDLVKAMKFLIQFNITKNGKVIANWTTDTKVDGGQVYRSEANATPDAVVTIDDDNYVKILFGELNPQRAFMTGKVKVRGNVLLLQKLDSFWNQVQGSRDDPEYPNVKEIMLKDPIIPGLLCESIIFDLIQRIVRLPKLFDKPTVIRFDITKNGHLASTWVLKYTSDKPFGFIRRGDSNTSSDITLTIDDNDFARLAYHLISFDNAISNGRINYKGDEQLVAKIRQIFSTPTIKSKL